MRELIIGMDGFIGRNLCRHLPDAIWTTRRYRELQEGDSQVLYFDMLEHRCVPEAEVVYLCAGVNGPLTCDNDKHGSYRTNVDGTIWIADQVAKRKDFLVWISSTTVEWMSEAYATQKRQAETYLRALDVGIVRAGRVLQSNVDDLCKLMIQVGRSRKRGLFLWNENEQPYQH